MENKGNPFHCMLSTFKKYSWALLPKKICVFHSEEKATAFESNVVFYNAEKCKYKLKFVFTYFRALTYL